MIAGGFYSIYHCQRSNLATKNEVSSLGFNSLEPLAVDGISRSKDPDVLYTLESIE